MHLECAGINTPRTNKEAHMVAALLVLLLLILLFGGLGIFVAKVFFIALAVAVLVSLATGGFFVRRR
jgi:hypothetical protein